MPTNSISVPGSVRDFDRKTLFPHERAALDVAFSKIGGSAGTRVLDMGCGRGRTTAILVDEYGADVQAFDIDPKILSDAAKARPDIEFRIDDATKLAGYPGSTFDLVLFSFNGIDYIPTRSEREACYAQVARVLRQGGVFVYSSHNRWALLSNKDARRIFRHNIWRLLIGADMLYEPGRMWSLALWHGTPETEIAMLNKAGLHRIGVWSRRRGIPSDDVDAAKGEHWPYYIALKR